MADGQAAAQGRIFISYRREDSAYPAGWLFDRLSERFGREQIFKDVDSIELGDDFVEEIGEAVGQTDVLLALIGDKWLTVADEVGGRRLDDPDDFVRLEIEAALARRVRVIPILVEGASMPREEQLPASLSPLARRQALELSPARFSSDTAKLMGVLEKALAEARAAEEQERTRQAETAAPAPPAPPAEPPSHGPRRDRQRRLLLAAGGAVLLLALIVGGVFLLGGEDEPAPAPAAPPETTTAAEGQDEAPPGPAVNGRIAFVEDEEIWSVRPDGSGLRQMTQDFADVRRPEWSPDGTKVAFSSNRGNAASDYDLWILDVADGSTSQLTTGPAEDGSPTWSPDGTEIAFGRGAPGQDEKDIWIVSADGGEPRQVTSDPADDDAPDWGSTGRIAFESRRDGNYEIWTLDPTGLENDVRQVTSNGWGDFSPDWSPDGSRIAYRIIRGEQRDIFTIDALGTERPRRLTGGTADDHRPSWSPDGTLIAFDSEVDGQTDVLLIPSGGGEVFPLLEGAGSQDSPAWGIAP
jgi:TIR domain/WD40-like Beta Propeller Repeat